jgi:mlo protein
MFNLFFQHSFVKQFYGSVTKSDYTTMRLGFIMVRITQQLT